MPKTEQLLVWIDVGLKAKVKNLASEKGVSLKVVVEDILKSQLGDNENVTLAISKFNFSCGKCGRDFESTKPKPKVCPFCKSYTWDTPRKEKMIKPSYPHLCEGCGFQWTTSTEAPRSCPSCKSLSWNPNSQYTLQKKFEALFYSKGPVSTHEIAPLMKMDHIELAGLVQGKRTLTAELLDRLKDVMSHYLENK